ncbi:MAG TPA: cytochrome D1 domain-containing protein, partial [Thermoanaerobaculia bacterium]|nr:cytochrome D1 domain-containing protein [Thermoanaerobaculia bacterium]
MSLAVLLAATVFVTNERAGSVTVIDSSTDKVVKTIAVGTRTRGMALSPDGKRLYVAVSHFRDRPAHGPDEIAVVDTKSFRITDHFKSGTDPEGVALSPDGKRLFISNEDAGTASIIDSRTGRTVAALVVGTEPEGVATSHDGKWAYITGETS